MSSCFATQDAFLRVRQNGKETERLAVPCGEVLQIEFGMRNALSARFYLGNDERVLLQEDAYFVRDEGEYRVFAYTLQTERIAPDGGGLFFFHFEAETPSGRRYTVCDGASLSLSDRFVNEFQLTVYRLQYQTPDWLNRGVFYHIFVDRFCKSGKVPKRADTPYCDDWENGIPEYPPVAGQEYPNHTHFGGDLYGIAEKLPYLQELGVTVLYLSPISQAYSNHKYDTGDYLRVDDAFGGEDALAELIRKAHEKGIRVMLDGVFNHVGEDSLYFNRYGNYPSVGACQSEQSAYYPWFRFERYPDVYECWWGIRNLPRTVKCDDFRNFICEQVIPHYLRMGIDGYRLDVADELDSGFLEQITQAIKREKPDAAVIGEVWEDASNKIAYGERKRYFLGKQLDGVMNYPLRNGLIAFLRDGDASLLRTVTQTLYCHYPIPALAHTMNSIGTHDTERILTVLGGDADTGEPNEVLAHRRMTEQQRERAIRLLCCGYALLAALPGVPCIYYGDEAGLEGYHDPFNRLPFPWGHIEQRLFACIAEVNRVRKSEPLFACDGFRVLNSPDGTFAFCRFDEENQEEELFVVSNRSEHSVQWTLPAPARELLSGKTVSGEQTVPPYTTWICRKEELASCQMS